jgi:hypothetical protein
MIPPADVGESVVVRLKYSGPLGGTVWQRYMMYIQERGQRRDWFVQRERYTQPSTPDAQPIIIV